jgi:hypothetical protein
MCGADMAVGVMLFTTVGRSFGELRLIDRYRASTAVATNSCPDIGTGLGWARLQYE